MRPFLYTSRGGKRWLLVPRPYEPEDADSGLVAAQDTTLGGKPYAKGDKLPGGPIFDGPAENIVVKRDRSPDLDQLIERGIAERAGGRK